MMPEPVLKPLTGWSVICLRPGAQQPEVRRAVRARGGMHVALPGLRLASMPEEAPARAALREALACPAVAFVAPDSVPAAAGRARASAAACRPAAGRLPAGCFVPKADGAAGVLPHADCPAAAGRGLDGFSERLCHNKWLIFDEK